MPGELLLPDRLLHPLRLVRSARQLALIALGVMVAGCGDDGALDDPDLGAADGGMDAGATPDGSTVDGGSVADLGSADAFVPPDLGPAATYFGTVRYEDRPQDRSGFTGAVVPLGAPGVLVELLDDRGGVLESVRTDAAGAFAFEATTGGATIRALSDASFGDHRVVVTDRRRRPSLYSVAAAATADGPTELLAAASETGGPFNVAAVSWLAFQTYAPYVGAAAPTLAFRWEAGRAFPCGSCYGGDEVSLGGGLDDTDEYDDVIIVHELGHYFVEHYSADSSPGGAHRDLQVEPVLAYGEGLAYAFAGVVLGAPWVIDTFSDSVRFIDFEAMTIGGAGEPTFTGTTDGTATGNLREEIVSAILWDAFDGPSGSEPFDRVALGLAEWMALLVDHFGGGAVTDRGATGIDLTDLLDALVCVSAVPAADVAALAADRDFPWSAPDC